MEIRTTRQTNIREKVDILIVYIGEDRYTLKETSDGRLQINKMNDGDKSDDFELAKRGDTDLIRVHARTGNEIELS